MLEVELPYPPSVNHYWRMWRGRMVMSEEGRAYRHNICAMLSGNGPRKPPSGGRIALCMDAFPPDRRRRDLDNLQKALLDSLQHGGVYADDSQVDLLIARRGAFSKPGHVQVRIDEFPLCRCLLCGGPFNSENN